MILLAFHPILFLLYTRAELGLLAVINDLISSDQLMVKKMLELVVASKCVDAKGVNVCLQHVLQYRLSSVRKLWAE